MDRAERNKKLVSLLCERGAKKIEIFGSVARGEERVTSDIDILVEFDGSPSLLDVVRIEREVSEEIGKKLDLVTKDSLGPYIRDKILKEAILIYER